MEVRVTESSSYQTLKLLNVGVIRISLFFLSVAAFNRGENICKWGTSLTAGWSQCHFTNTDQNCGPGFKLQPRKSCLCKGKIVLNTGLCGIPPVRIKYCFNPCNSKF